MRVIRERAERRPDAFTDRWVKTTQIALSSPG